MRRLSFAALTLVLASCTKDAKDVTGPPNLGLAAVDSLAPLFEMNSPQRIPGEYLVRFKDDVGDSELLAQQLVAAHSGQAHAIWKGLKGFWATLPAQAIEALRRNPRIKYIEANTRMHTATTFQPITVPADNWGLDRIDQLDNPRDGIYAYDHDGSGVHIWILDTGVNDAVSEIAARIDHSSYFTYNGTDPFTPCHSHGTSVAIMAAGSVHGVAKGATINVARISDDCINSPPTVSSGAASSAFDCIAQFRVGEGLRAV